MPTLLDFVTLDVFTSTPYEGNPLAIVKLDPNTTITQEQKAKIAKEFNLSETVFLHTVPNSDGEFVYDIFTITGEIPWAGHPTIGTICYLGNKGAPADPDTLVNISKSFNLRAKAGPIKADFGLSDGFAAAEIAHKFHVHKQGIPKGKFLESQPALQQKIAAEGVPYPIASIVNGMNFVLVELESLKELSLVSTTSTNIKYALESLDSGWDKTLLGAYFFTVLEERDGFVKVRSRMIEAKLGEDPATGSAACDLACYLATKIAQPNLEKTYLIEQGVEMGRRSLIRVQVDLDDASRIKVVTLSGQAVRVQEGRIAV